MATDIVSSTLLRYPIATLPLAPVSKFTSLPIATPLLTLLFILISLPIATLPIALLLFLPIATESFEPVTLYPIATPLPLATLLPIVTDEPAFAVELEPIRTLSDTLLLFPNVLLSPIITFKSISPLVFTTVLFPKTILFVRNPLSVLKVNPSPIIILSLVEAAYKFVSSFNSGATSPYMIKLPVSSYSEFTSAANAVYGIARTAPDIISAATIARNEPLIELFSAFVLCLPLL